MTAPDIDHTLETLLELDGQVFFQSTGEWTKIEARLVEPSEGRPHGVKYSLTLHRRSGERILGYDNAHAVDAHRRMEWDHKHLEEKVLPYKYVDSGTLLAEFFSDVNRWLKDEHEDD
jgi:hypothetical protein